MWENQEKHVKSYQLQKIDEFWKNEIYLENWKNKYNFSLKSPNRILKFYKDVEKKECEIKSILLKYNVSEIIIGNRYTPIDRHFAIIARSLGIKVSLMEDGMRNYIDESSVNTLNPVTELIRRGIFGRYYTLNSFSTELSLDKRYCLLPLNNDENTVKIEFGKNISKELKSYLERYLSEVNGGENTLFLSQSLSEDNEIYQEDEIEIIVQELLKEKEKKIYFKFHPRDSENKKKKIIENLKKENIKYIDLSFDIDIPIELFTNQLSIKKIVGWWSANTFLFFRCK